MTRIRRKTPATTIVDLCSRADTGVGPSIAAGSQAWRENWADLPMAAISVANRRIFCHLGALFLMNFIFVIFHPFEIIRTPAIRIIIPMSPIRL